VQAVGFVGRSFAVAPGERLEPRRMVLALGRELAAEMLDVGLVRVRGGDLAERVGEVELGAVEQAEVVGEVHG
jgi:hypothetical protein